MAHRSRIAIILFAIGLLIFSAGCNLLPTGLKGLTATETPTRTKRPTKTSAPAATATLQSTATATKTPRPAVSFTSCAFRSDECPDAVSVVDFLKEDQSPADGVDVIIPFDQKIHIVEGWYAIDQATLDQNVSHMQFFFTIDGKDYYQDYMLEQGYYTDENGVEYPGVWAGVALDDWTIGESHRIEIGFVTDATINDGWGDYDPGLIGMSSFNFIPSKQPTATPEPTITSTPKPYPTNTKSAFVPTNTTGSLPPAEIVLRVINHCSEQHTVIFSGPWPKIKFVVDPGQTVENMVPIGEYTWVIDNMYYGGPQTLNVDVWYLPLCE